MTDLEAAALSRALHDLVEHPVVAPDLADRVIDRHRRRRVARVVAGTASVVLVAAVTAVLLVAGPVGAPAPRLAVAGPAAGLYTGSAPLLSVRGGPFTACVGGVLASLPPAGCSGVALSGVVPSELPPGTWSRAADGTVQTLALALVGRWDGERLVLARPPTRATSATPVGPPACPVPTAAGTARTAAVTGDLTLLAGHHARPFSWGPCGDGVFLLVPVADPATVAFLTDRYPGAVVRGWLRPYPAGAASPRR